MGFRDRFFTPTTAKALLSWRILLGIAVGVGVGFLLAPAWGVGAGIGVYVASVMGAMPKTPRSTIDPFAISEPWRHFVQGTQRARSSLRQALNATNDGPLKARLTDIAGRLEQAVEESWAIAKRGDEIDAAVNRIDPVRLRSQLATLTKPEPAATDRGGRPFSGGRVDREPTGQRRPAQGALREHRRPAPTHPGHDLTSSSPALPRSSVGTSDTDTYEHDVDNLVVELEGLRLAVAETNETA